MSINRVSTGNPTFDELIPRIQAFLAKDTMDMQIDGEAIRGYRSPDTPAVWIRDHSDMMRGFRYFENDLTSAVQHFADTQARNGRVFDYFTTQPEKVPCEKENWCKYVRVPVEADVEYRFIKAAYLAWQSSGKDEWIRALLPNLEAALHYAFSHPHRWDPKHKLVKRPYTIDSWDFAYTAGSHDWLQFQIDENTFWGIMHGDNSGFFEACSFLGQLYRHFDDTAKAEHWQTLADGLKKRMNDLCWNGSFYTHFIKETPVTIDGVDEASQLSFSNAMNINRGVTTLEQAQLILQEYLNRRSKTDAFAEWFSIEPSFPAGIFGEEKIVEGAYCNGGIMPLVGGELARAYFENGFESEGVRTLETYYKLISEKDETYLWYFPDGRASTVDTSTSPDATPTDGWGSSAMLYGFIEGLIGIQDQGKLFQKTRLAPRWHAAGQEKADVSLHYPTSQATYGYQYRTDTDSITLEIEAQNNQTDLHLLIPSDFQIKSVQDSTGALDFSISKVGKSTYLDCSFPVNGANRIEIMRN